MHAIDGHLLIALGVDQKILPASVINQVSKERAEQIAADQGYPVGRRQMRELKERVADELRTRAFSRRSSTCAWLDTQNKLLIVDAAAPAKAEELVAVLRDTIPNFSAVLLETEKSPAVSMSAWLMFGDAPGRFNIEQDLELQSVKDEKSIVRYVRHPLEGKEVQKHIGSGKAPTKLGMSWNGRIAFLLTSEFHIKRLQFLDMVKDRSEGQAQAAEEQFEIDFVLMTGELSHLLKDLIEQLGGDVKTGAQQAA